MINNTLDLDALKKCNSGLYVITSDSTKQAYLSHSSNIVNALGGILNEIKHSSFVIRANDLSFKLLDNDGNNEVISKLHMQYYIEMYQQLGYTVLNKRNPMKLKVIVQLVERKYVVRLESSNHKYSLTVGTFSSNMECTEFLTKYYQEKYVDTIVYYVGPR